MGRLGLSRMKRRVVSTGKSTHFRVGDTPMGWETKLVYGAFFALAVLMSGCSPHRSQPAEEDRSQVRIANSPVQSTSEPSTKAETPRSPLDLDWNSSAHNPEIETRFLSQNPLINQIEDLSLRARLSLVWDWLSAQNQAVSLKHMQTALEWWVRSQGEAEQHPALKLATELSDEIARQMLQDRAARLPVSAQVSAPPLNAKQLGDLTQRIRFFVFMMQLGDLRTFLDSNAGALSTDQKQKVDNALHPLQLSIVARFALAQNLQELNHMDREFKRVLDEARVLVGLTPMQLDQYSRYQ